MQQAMLTESYKGLTVEHMRCVQSFQLKKLPLAAIRVWSKPLLRVRVTGEGLVPQHAYIWHLGSNMSILSQVFFFFFYHL